MNLQKVEIVDSKGNRWWFGCNGFCNNYLVKNDFGCDLCVPLQDLTSNDFLDIADKIRDKIREYYERYSSI